MREVLHKLYILNRNRVNIMKQYPKRRTSEREIFIYETQIPRERIQKAIINISEYTSLKSYSEVLQAIISAH